MASQQIVFCIIIILFGVGLAKIYEEYPSKELLEMFQPIHKYCRNFFELTEEDIKTYDVMTNDDYKMKCYMACVLKQSNWMTGSNRIKYDCLTKDLWGSVPGKIVANFDKCRDIEDNEDECILVHNFAKCVYEADPEHWFWP